MVFKLFSTLASNSDADPRDVRNVKSYLGDSGFIKSKKQYDPYPNSELFGGIKKFQRKNGLKVDGIMKPNGETEIAFGRSPRIPCPGIAMNDYDCGAWHGDVTETGLCENCYKHAIIRGEI